MKTTVIGSGKETATAKNTATENKTTIRPSIAPKDKDNQTVENKTAEEVKAIQPQTGAAPEPKATPTKTELKEQLAEQKAAMNLEATIKLALDLNRRINQRGRLLETIETLEAFDIAQKDDAEADSHNHYQGCELSISDDKGRDFTTKNPFIIKAVAQMVNQLCVDKLAEIESEIFIPVK